MTAPNPKYRNQCMPLFRPTVGGHRFFNVRDRETLDLIEYCYAHYAAMFNVELVLLIVLPDTIVCAINDPEANGSAFEAAAHAAIVRRFNKRTGHIGSMIQPGVVDAPGVLDKDGELERLAELAASPTVAIQPSAAGYIGTIYTPESRDKTRKIRRPDDLNPKTYPNDVITYTIAKPQLHKEDSWYTIEKRLKAARLKVEAKNRQKRRASGKPYIGINAPALVDPTIAHPDRLSPPKGARHRGAPDLVETARRQERHFRREYRKCLHALRAGKTDIVWPPGTNFHHKVNGFPRLPGDWLNPPPPA